MGLKEPLRFSHSGLPSLLEDLKKTMTVDKEFSYQGKIIIDGDVFLPSFSFLKEKIQDEKPGFFEGYVLNFIVKRHPLSPWEENVFTFISKEAFAAVAEELERTMGAEVSYIIRDRLEERYFWKQAHLLLKKK